MANSNNDQRYQRLLASQARERRSVIYFIRRPSSGLIKIGVSSDPMSRIAALQTAADEPLELLGLCQGGRIFESVIHRLLADHHSHGEWFRDCRMVQTILAGISYQVSGS
jgi:T5orf172 domain